MAVKHRFSSAGRTVQCPASVLYPGDPNESDAAKEGTLAHSVAMGLSTSTDPDMLAGAKLFNDDIAMFEKTSGGKAIRESFIVANYVHPGNGGTPDAWLFDRIGDTLYVWEYKYGHAYVDHYKNWQLINAVAALLPQVNWQNTDKLKQKVMMRVVQPRNYDKRGPVRGWETNVSHLQGYIEHLKDRYTLADHPDPPHETGPECDNCPARHKCLALQQSAYRGIESSVRGVPVELSGAAVGVELSILRKYRDRMDQRITGLEEQAKKMLQSGQAVIGHHLERGIGREYWLDKDLAVMVLGDRIVKKNELITPKQAIAAGCPESEVKNLIGQPLGDVKIKPDGTAIQSIFNKGI